MYFSWDSISPYVNFFPLGIKIGSYPKPFFPILKLDILPSILLILLINLFVMRGALDVLAVGEEEALSLGIRPQRVRWIVIAAASLASASAVAVSGLIAFVGIIVPHAVRLVVGASNRVVVPLSFLIGAAFLTLTDLLARTLQSPAELPIGVVTAFFGAPFFLFVLRRRSDGVI